MIDNIKKFSKKSFDNYSTPNGFFNEKNLLFGYNGRGKSSLAEGIIEEYLTQEGVKENHRYFNKSYIDRNLIIENSDRIKGVEATFSERDVDVKNELQRLKESIRDEEKPISELNLLKKEIRNLIDSKHDSKKGKLNINKKPKNKTIEEIIQLYNKDILEAKKFQNNEQVLISYQGDDILEKKINQIELVNLPDLFIDDFIESDYKKMYEILVTSYEEMYIPSSKIIAWLNEGISFHEDIDNCKFCGNKLDYYALEKRILEYNNNEKQKSKMFIEMHFNTLSKWIKKVKNETNENKIGFMKNYFNDTGINELLHEFSIYLDVIEKTIHKLAEKTDDMNLHLELNEEELEKAIIHINDIHDKFKNMKYELLGNLRVQFNNQEILVKGAIGLSIVKDKVIEKNLRDLKIKTKEFNELLKQNSEDNIKIQELTNQSSSHEDFRIFLNSVLKDIEIDLKLVTSETGKNYTIQHRKIKDTPLTIKDISEGEKNLLALLFFYFELYGDDQQDNLKKNINLIVIDDPISSLDDANKFYVLEIMKKIFIEKGVQVFILTHVWNDFYQLSYGNKQNDRISKFEIFKNDNSNSEIRIISSNVKPYKKIFKEIHVFSANGNSHIPTDCELYHVPNSMRRVFEEFLQFKSDVNIIPTQAQRDSVEAIIIQGTDDKEFNGVIAKGGSYLSRNKKIKLRKLLTLINVLSHNAQYNPVEVLQSAKFLMKLIEDMDKAHFVAMKR